MPFIQFNGQETPSSLPMPPVGVPVEFEISSISDEPSKSQKPMITVVHKVIGTEAEGMSIYNYFTDLATNIKSRIALKQLYEAVKVPWDDKGVATEPLLGTRGKFVLKAEQYEGKEGRKVASYLKA